MRKAWRNQVEAIDLERLFFYLVDVHDKSDPYRD